MSTLTDTEVQIRAMDNTTLALALEKIETHRGDYKRALVAEAARRIRWPDVYAKRTKA
jgi:hypothetical protein